MVKYTVHTLNIQHYDIIGMDRKKIAQPSFGKLGKSSFQGKGARRTAYGEALSERKRR